MGKLLLIQRAEEPIDRFVRRAMLELDIRTADELAELSGLPASTLSSVLSGRPPAWETVEALMQALALRLVRVEPLAEEKERQLEDLEALRAAVGGAANPDADGAAP